MFFVGLRLSDRCQRQNQSHTANDSQSVSQSVSPGFEPPRELMTRFCYSKNSCGFVRHGASSLTGEWVCHVTGHSLCITCMFIYIVFCLHIHRCRSQGPRGLKHVQSSTARILGSWVQIALEACMHVRVFPCCAVRCR